MSPKSKGWSDPEESARSAEVAPIADVLRGLMAQRPFARGATLGVLARSWPDVVGERLAAETAPSRLEGGVLVVEASSGPWGSQATFLAEEIRKRANEVLEAASVKQVRVVISPGRLDRPKPL